MSDFIRFRHVARLTIEFTTPFLVGSGRESDLSDAVPVTDANGLPAVPGSSIAGVLRHGLEVEYGAGAAEDVFGATAGDDSHGSRLWITWAHIHDASNRPVEGLLLREDLDEVLQNALALSIRDHVRISHRGAADTGGKFDQDVVTAGHRFTFEMMLEGPADSRDSDEGVVRWLLSFLAGGGSRLGGSGRRGMGAFRVVPGGCKIRTFDLFDRKDAEEFGRHPVRLDEPATTLLDFDPESCPSNSPQGAGKPRFRTLRLELQPLDYWSFAGGEPWLLSGEQEARAPDFNPVREVRIRWDQGKGVVDPPRLYVPGSAVKGPLAHRVAFHDNLLNGHFADGASDEDAVAGWAGEGNMSVRALFGSIHTSTKGDLGVQDHAGRVYIDDVWLPMDADAEGRTQRVMHNSSDRFTGGVRSGILFEERLLYGGAPFEVFIGVEGFDDLPEITRNSFREAVRDLAEGRIQLGSGGGRGHGVFESPIPFDEVWAEFKGGGK